MIGLIGIVRSVLLFGCMCLTIVAGAGTGAAASGMIDDAREHATIIAMGRATFQQFCAPCHGVSGTGHGPVASSLLTAPPDLTRLRRSHNGEFPLMQLENMLRAIRPDTISAHRSEQMPGWGPVFLSIDSSVGLAHARTANLLAYLESIQK